METKYPYLIRFFYVLIEYCFWIIFKFCPRKKSIKSDIINLLIIEPYQMGDVVSISSMFDPILQFNKNIRIFLLIKNSNLNIYENDDRVYQQLVVNLPWTIHGKLNFIAFIKNTRFFLKSLKDIRQNYFFNFGLEPRGDIKNQILLRFLGCNEIVGYSKLLGTNISTRSLILDKAVTPNQLYLQRYSWNRYLLTGIGIPESNLFPISYPILKKSKSDLIQNSKIKFVIHVGSGWIYRRWPINNWIIFIQKVILLYPYVNINVICGLNELEVYNELIKKFDSKKNEDSMPYISFKVLSDFIELYTIINNCSIFMGLDSGPLHVADSLNIPVLGLYGPGNSQIWKPVSENSLFIHKFEKFECHPCNQRDCQFPNSNCMDAISVDEVLELFKKILKKIV